MDVPEIMKPKKEKKSKAQSNREYYMKHKEANHRTSLLSDIRINGRVPHLYTILKRKLQITDVLDAWKIYESNMKQKGEDIPELKLLEMRLLIGNMV